MNNETMESTWASFQQQLQNETSEFNYEETCEEESIKQGITPIVSALVSMGIEASSEQTGGFTMCAYVELKDGFYIYANPFGVSAYNSEDYEKDIAQFDTEQKPQVIAQIIHDYIKAGA